jgi:[acyl-carrier-protein] S-malonyltransferase
VDKKLSVLPARNASHSDAGGCGYILIMKNRALLFSGQGAQAVGMGRDLYEQSKAARALYDQAEAALKFPLKEYSFNGPEDKLTDTSVCQPALYVHGLALLAAAREQKPDFNFAATAGLSLGEYTAHAAAGSFDFITGLNLVYHRGRLMQEACSQTQGGMISLIGATSEQAIDVAKEAGLEAANFNCPGQVVLSGLASQISKAVEIAKAKGIRKAVPLKVNGGYHSKLMASARAGLQPWLDKAEIKFPAFMVVSNFTAKPVSQPDDIRRTLSEQVCGSVRWEESVRLLIGQGINQFVEFGPGAVLAGLMKRIDPNTACLTIGDFAALRSIA